MDDFLKKTAFDELVTRNVHLARTISHRRVEKWNLLPLLVDPTEPPAEAPFDGRPVYLKTRGGVVIARWQQVDFVACTGHHWQPLSQRREPINHWDALEWAPFRPKETP